MAPWSTSRSHPTAPAIAIACTSDAARYCGMIGDNCGGKLDCGDCPSGQICRGNICAPDFGDACVALKCTQTGGTYCGRIGDGCGQLLDCGSCHSPMTCGGGGLPSICGANPRLRLVPRRPRRARRPTGVTAASSAMDAAVKSIADLVPPARAAAPRASRSSAAPPIAPSRLAPPPTAPAIAAKSVTAAAARWTAAIATGGQTCGGGGHPRSLRIPAGLGRLSSHHLPASQWQILRRRRQWLRRSNRLRQLRSRAKPAALAAFPTSALTRPIPASARRSAARRPTANTAASSAMAAAVKWTAALCTGGDTCGGGGIDQRLRRGRRLRHLYPHRLHADERQILRRRRQWLRRSNRLWRVPGAVRPAAAAAYRTFAARPPIRARARPRPVHPPNGTYCGNVGNGCGGTLSCGTCPAGQVCGARTPNVCGKPCPLCGQVPTCADGGAGADGGTTTVSGTAFTPALTKPDPLYGALVYIPNIALGTKLPPVHRRTELRSLLAALARRLARQRHHRPRRQVHAQQRAGRHGDPARRPARRNGAVRRRSTFCPASTTCSRRARVRLPRNQSRGRHPAHGDLHAASVDTLECLLRKIGISDSEFTNPSGTGRMRVYQGMGNLATPDDLATRAARIDANTPAEAVLTGSTRRRRRMVEVRPDPLPVRRARSTRRPHRRTRSRTSSTTSTAAGASSPRTSATSGSSPTVGSRTSAQWQVRSRPAPTDPLTGTIDTSFPKGAGFRGVAPDRRRAAIRTPPRASRINEPRHDLNTITPGNGAQRWIYSDTTPPTRRPPFSTSPPTRRSAARPRPRAVASSTATSTSSTHDRTDVWATRSSPPSAAAA